jgi:branched-chain amino acid transport system ATP-binding protein
MSTLLSVDGLTVRFGGITAVDAVSFEVADGELLGVIGPNGAGKSSLFNALTGVYPATGSARLDGLELVDRKAPAVVRAGVSRTFQNLGLFESLDVISNVLIGGHTQMRGGTLAGALWWGRAKKQDRAARERCTDLLDLLQLSEHRHTVVSELPYGIKKRVDLARALAARPRVLLLDEPVAGMNTEESREVAGYIQTVRSDLHMTIVLVEHDMPLVMGMADHVVVLDFGRLICDGTPAEVQSAPAVIEAYLGAQAAHGGAGPSAPPPTAPSARQRTIQPGEIGEVIL